jgi:hypothetical protein
MLTSHYYLRQSKIDPNQPDMIFSAPTPNYNQSPTHKTPVTTRQKVSVTPYCWVAAVRASGQINRESSVFFILRSPYSNLAPGPSPGARNFFPCIQNFLSGIQNISLSIQRTAGQSPCLEGGALIHRPNPPQPRF